MTALAFDTLAITKRLKSHGFTEAQAEAITNEIQHSHEISLENLATKADIKDIKADIKNLEQATKADILRLEQATKADINNVRGEMREMELRLKVTMGTMIVGLGAFLAAIKFL